MTGGLRGAARQLRRRVSRQRSLRWRRPPSIRTTDSSASPTIYYLCPDYPFPTGGIRAIYRHVDILNRAGRSAAVLHHSDGYACDWFEHSTRVIGAPSAQLGPDDLLVIPEVYGPFLDRLPQVPRLVGFNQNAYLTFHEVPEQATLPYDIFSAVMTVSGDSADFLRFAFPGLEVSVVGNSVDPNLFHPTPGAPEKRLALMPRKRPEEALMIRRLLGDRLAGWEVVEIENASERETAAAYRSAPIFLALGKQEGFGLPPAEAMASGCWVVGFPAFGGRDIFDPAWSTPIEDGDVLSAAREIAALLRLYEQNPEVIREGGLRAAEHIHERFSPERQSEQLLAFYDRLG